MHSYRLAIHKTLYYFLLRSHKLTSIGEDAASSKPLLSLRAASNLQGPGLVRGVAVKHEKNDQMHFELDQQNIYAEQVSTENLVACCANGWGHHWNLMQPHCKRVCCSGRLSLSQPLKKICPSKKMKLIIVQIKFWTTKTQKGIKPSPL